MTEHDQQKQGLTNDAADLGTTAQVGSAADAPAAGTVTTPDGEKKTFVPYFNEEYQFKLGTLGDVETAYRLGAIFVLMLIAAALMYLGAWWWVGTHPLAQH